MFDQLVSENTARTRRPLAVALSFAGQVLLVALTVLFPMLHTEAIMPGRLLRLVGAPLGRGDERPVAQKPHGRVASGPHRIAVLLFRQPSQVPNHILPDEGAPAEELVAGPAGPSLPGAPNGVPWGTGTDLNQVPQPPPPKPAPPRPAIERVSLRVSSGVQAAKILHQVLPVYPPLARQARISGTVRLEAVISRNGMVESLVVTSGHPLLVQAAVEAVRQWIYRPTLLNGNPVEVLTQIEVHFKLGE